MISFYNKDRKCEDYFNNSGFLIYACQLLFVCKLRWHFLGQIKPTHTHVCNFSVNSSSTIYGNGIYNQEIPKLIYQSLLWLNSKLLILRKLSITASKPANWICLFVSSLSFHVEKASKITYSPLKFGIFSDRDWAVGLLPILGKWDHENWWNTVPPFLDATFWMVQHGSTIFFS
jgi:hypothetical protein